MPNRKRNRNALAQRAANKQTKAKRIANLIPGGKKPIENRVTPIPSRTVSKKTLHNEMPETDRKQFPQPHLHEVQVSKIYDILDKLARDRNKTYNNCLVKKIKFPHKNNIIDVKRLALFTTALQSESAYHHDCGKVCYFVDFACVNGRCYMIGKCTGCDYETTDKITTHNDILFKTKADTDTDTDFVESYK